MGRPRSRSTLAFVDPTDNESRARNPVSSASTLSSEARAAAAGARLARELICVALADAHAGPGLRGHRSRPAWHGADGHTSGSGQRRPANLPEILKMLLLFSCESLGKELQN